MSEIETSVNINQIKQLLESYLELNQLTFRNMRAVTDHQLASVCPDMDIMLVRNIWNSIRDDKVADYTNNNIQMFINNSVATNQELIDLFPAWACKTDIQKGTLTIYWNDLPDQEGGQA